MAIIGLSEDHRAFLYFVELRPGITSTELADLFMCSKYGLQRISRLLVRRKYVDSEKLPNCTAYTLSERGQAYVKKMKVTMNEEDESGNGCLQT